VGKAITDLLMMPGITPVRDLLGEHLGAERAQRFDVVELLYTDEEGLLFLVSRGTPWVGEGQFAGIRSIIEPRLPWESDRLESQDAFVAGLDEPVDAAMLDVVRIADTLQVVEDDLGEALDDPNFQSYYLPGEVFHDRALSLQLGRSEVHALRGVVSIVRGALYLVAAYQHDWTLARAFGSFFDEEVVGNPDHPDYVEGWTRGDYARAYLDRRLGRAVRDPGLLASAQRAMGRGFASLSSSIDVGLQAPRDFTLQFNALGDTERRELDELARVLDGISNAFYGPTSIPNTEPATTLDLSVFFREEGRVLPEERDWLVREEPMPDGPEQATWSLRDEAIQEIFVDGVVLEPQIDLVAGDALPGLALQTEGGLEALVRAASGTYLDSVERTYFSGQ
jgi:hypothetical protein